MTTDSTATPPSDPAAPSRPFGALPLRNWRWFLVRGLLMIAFGVVALFVPGLTLFAFAAVFAGFSFIDGVAGLISGVRGARRHEPRWWTLVLAGLAGIAVGVLFAIWPLLSTALYATVALTLIAGWAVAAGLLQLVAAVRLRREIQGEWLLGLVGVLTMALGLWLLALLWIDPLPTLLSVGWLIGLWAILAGVSLVALALRLRGKQVRAGRVPRTAPTASSRPPRPRR